MNWFNFYFDRKKNANYGLIDIRKAICWFSVKENKTKLIDVRMLFDYVYIRTLPDIDFLCSIIFETII